MTGGPEDGVEALFEAAMRAVGLFEPYPVLAVALSGGADSTALLLLADGWARARGGHVVALLVDHGLRPGSGDEAALVARDCARRGIDQRILRWAGPHPGRQIGRAHV